MYLLNRVNILPITDLYRDNDQVEIVQRYTVTREVLQWIDIHLVFVHEVDDLFKRLLLSKNRTSLIEREYCRANRNSAKYFEPRSSYRCYAAHLPDQLPSHHARPCLPILLNGSIPNRTCRSFMSMLCKDMMRSKV